MACVKFNDWKTLGCELYTLREETSRKRDFFLELETQKALSSIQCAINSLAQLSMPCGAILSEIPISTLCPLLNSPYIRLPGRIMYFNKSETK